MDLIICLKHRTIVIIKPPVKEEKKSFFRENKNNQVQNIKFLYCSMVQNVDECFKYLRVPIQACESNMSQSSIVFNKQCFPVWFHTSQKNAGTTTISKFLQNNRFFLKISIDSTAYLVRTLLGPQVDKRISWVCEINYSGNLKAGRLNKIPVALQTKGLNYSLKTSNNCNNKASGKGRKKFVFPSKQG